jgi:hypothetical protein
VTLELDPGALRAAALRAAVRRGDALAAASAWARVRIDPTSVDARDRAAAHAARIAVGRAIRDARWRRIHAATTALAAVPAADEATSPARSRLVRMALVAAALGAIGLAFLLQPRDEGFAPAAAAPELRVETTAQASIGPTGARGRTSASATPVAFVAPETTPAPSAPAETAPVGTPVTGGQPGGVPGGQPGGVPSGTPGGVPGGVPGGTGKATPAPTPTPAPSVNTLPINPPPLSNGFDRITFRVIDSRSLMPLSGVCVVYGIQTCGPEQPHTNVLGLYWLDFDRSKPAASLWDFRFFRDAYRSGLYSWTYAPGHSATVEIRLRSN